MHLVKLRLGMVIEGQIWMIMVQGYSTTYQNTSVELQQGLTMT